MATFLFWNIARKPLRDEMRRLTERHEVDVLMLAESRLAPDDLLASLNGDGASWEFAAPISPLDDTKIQLYTRLGQQHLQELFVFPHVTVRELSGPDFSSLLLGVVHLPSKLWENPEDQTVVCTELSRQLRAIEEIVGHRRLLVVGDFNVNPFEAAMLSPTALNAEASRRVAARGSRNINGHAYPFFYNPMWNFFGDATLGPGGTYFFSGSKRVRVSWNIFDQVLLRPDLLPHFDTSELDILTTDGQRSFLNRNGTPDKTNVSDHLPILFKLKLT